MELSHAQITYCDHRTHASNVSNNIKYLHQKTVRINDERTALLNDLGTDQTLIMATCVYVSNYFIAIRVIAQSNIHNCYDNTHR